MLGSMKARTPANHQEKALVAANEAMVGLMANKSNAYVSAHRSRGFDRQQACDRSAAQRRPFS
jgi:hypothetical protein